MRIGRHHVLEVWRETLVVDGNRRTVGLLGRGHEKRIQANGGVLRAEERQIGQADVLLDRLAGRDLQGNHLGIEPGIKDLKSSGPSRGARDLVEARFIGENDEVGFLHGDAGVMQITTCHHILDTPSDGTGGSGLSGHKGWKVEQGEHGEVRAGAKGQGEQYGFHGRRSGVT